MILAAFLLTNITGQVVSTQKPAGIGRMAITKFIHTRYKEKPVHLIFCSWSNPYNPWQSLPEKFYAEKRMTDIQIKNLCEMNDSVIKPGVTNLLVMRKINLENDDCIPQFKKYRFRLLMQSIPHWIERINKYYRPADNEEIVLLYELEKTGDTD